MLFGFILFHSGGALCLRNSFILNTNICLKRIQKNKRPLTIYYYNIDININPPCDLLWRR